MDQAAVKRLNEINRRFYETVADDFDQTRRSAWPGWENLLPYLAPPLSVLDVGCGNGRFGLFLAQHFGVDVRYWGMDNNQALLQRARESLRDLPSVQFEQRDI